LTSDASAFSAAARPRSRAVGRWLPIALVAFAGLSLGALVGGLAITDAAGLAIVLGGTVAAAAGRPAIGLGILMLGLPFDLTVSVQGMEITATLALIFILGAIQLAHLLRQRGGLRWRWTPLDLPVALFAAATILSLAGLGGQLHDQLAAQLQAFAGLSLFFLATQGLSRRRDLWLVLGALLTTASLQAAGTILMLLVGGQPVSEASRVTGTLLDPNHFAGFLALTIPLVLAVGMSLPSRWAQVGAAGVILALTIALVATLSRSGWLGVVAGLVILMVFLPQQRPQMLALTAAAGLTIVVAGLAGPVGGRLAPHVLGPWEQLTSRWRIWTVAVDVFLHHSIFGVGLGNFHPFFAADVSAQYPGAKIDPANAGALLPIAHAHNLFLNIAAERGILGLCAFGLTLVALFRTLGQALAQAGSRLERAVVVGLLASFVAYFVHSLFDVSYIDDRILFLVWVLVGIAAVLPRLLSAPAMDPVEP
jgi:O-antigen ligase